MNSRSSLRYKSLSSALFISLFAATPYLHAQPRMMGNNQVMMGNGYCMNQGGRGIGMRNALNLTAEQQNKISQLQQQYWQQQQNSQNNRNWLNERNKVQALISQKNFDTKAATKLAEEKQGWRTEIMVNHWQHQHEIYKILTPSQQQIWKQRINTGGCMW